MNNASSKVKITYGSNSGRYYKGSRIKNSIIPSMPSIPSKNEISNKDSKIKKDIFDFNPDHDDFEARQLQRQRQRMGFTPGKSLSTVKKQPNSSIMKKTSSSGLDITSPIKIKKITEGINPKKSSTLRVNQRKTKEKKIEKEKEKQKTKNKYLKSNNNNANNEAKVIDLVDKTLESKKRKLNDESNNKNAKKEKIVSNNNDNNNSNDNIDIETKSKHERSNSLDSILSSSSLTSLSSLPSIHSPIHESSEIIEITEKPNKNNNAKDKSQKQNQNKPNEKQKEQEIIEIFSDNEKNTVDKPKITYKTKPKNTPTPTDKKSNSIKSVINIDDDDDDDVIIIDDSKAKPLSRSYSMIRNKTFAMKKSMSVNDYNRIKRQRLIQAKSRSSSQSVTSNSNSGSIQNTIYDNKGFEVDNSSQFDDTMLDLEVNI